jgi:hypothetical protein
MISSSQIFIAAMFFFTFFHISNIWISNCWFSTDHELAGFRLSPTERLYQGGKRATEGVAPTRLGDEVSSSHPRCMRILPPTPPCSLSCRLHHRAPACCLHFHPPVEHLLPVHMSGSSTNRRRVAPPPSAAVELLLCTRWTGAPPPPPVVVVVLLIRACWTGAPPLPPLAAGARCLSMPPPCIT